MKARTTILTASLATLLSACGLVANFVPPIDVTEALDPLEGQQVSATFEEVEGGAVVAQLRGTETNVADLEGDAIRTKAERTASRTGMEDLIPAMNTYGFSIARFNANIGLALEADLVRDEPEAAWPESFTLENVAVAMHASDQPEGSEARSVTLNMDRTLDLTFEKHEESGDGWTYRAVEGSAADALKVEESDRDAIMDLVAILQQGETPSPNNVSFDIELHADSTPSLAGFTATFTVTTGDATVKLGG